MITPIIKSKEWDETDFSFTHRLAVIPVLVRVLLSL